jgi:multiple sugar transport system ATP-binding protein
MRVDDNIAYPLKIKKMKKTERRTRAAEVGSHLGLEPLLLRRPAQLSGGQQQRVALARAMAFRPQLFLLDEPLSNLDARLRLEARTFLRRLQTEVATTTVYVTHDQAEALALADRIAVMEAGRVRQLGTPVEVFKRPANLFVAGFIGSLRMNLLPATVSGERLLVGESSVPVPPSAAGHVHEGEAVVLGARPEFCSLVAEGEEGIAGEVTILENLGTEYLVTVESGEILVQVTVDEGDEPAVGDRVRVRAAAERALVYRTADGNLVGSPAAERTPVEA